MYKEINAIAQQYFHKETLNDISREELEAFISRYPYSASARYLLAQKVYNDDTGSDDELVTAGLYLHNSLLLDWLLKHNKANPGVTEANPEVTESNPARESYFPHAVVAAPAAEGVSGSDAEQTATPSQPTPNQQTGQTTEPDSPIVFQSYHTIDYFASQGIRLNTEDLAKDRLGQQLKSFTEWLKSMKKLPKSEVDRPQVVDDSTQQQVISNAAHSIEEKEVVTEAMAEVWAKQGNTARAISIYNKLSLLDPAKSAYFAAKIDQLK